MMGTRLVTLTLHAGFLARQEGGVPEIETILNTR